MNPGKEVKQILPDVAGLLSANIYGQIKGRLAACEITADYEAAYKWLAEQFVEVNESAKQLESKVIAKYGEEEYGILLFGSKEAYEKEKAFEEKLSNASPRERESLFLEKIMTEPTCEEKDFPNLWGDECEEEEYPQAQ